MNKLNLTPLIALAIAGCASSPQSTNVTSGEESQIAAYRADVAIPEDTLETPELRECLRGYATGEQFSYGNTPETRWSWDVEPCLKFGPAPTKAELEARGIGQPRRSNFENVSFNSN